MSMWNDFNHWFGSRPTWAQYALVWAFLLTIGGGVIAVVASSGGASDDPYECYSQAGPYQC